MARPLLLLARILLVTFVALPAGQQDQACAGGPDTFGIRTVVLSGQPVPGLASTVVFNRFIAPTITDSGDLSFRAVLSGPGVDTTNDEAALIELDGQLRLVTRESTFAPPPNADRRFRGIADAFPLNNGEAVVGGFISASFGLSGVWATTNSGLQQINGPGFPVPGADGSTLPDYTWGNLNIATAYPNGLLLLQGNATNTLNGIPATGHWITKDGVTQLVIDRGGQASGTESGPRFPHVSTPSMNRSGHIAYEASYVRLFLDRPKSSIWTNRDGDLQIVAETGSMASEFGAGVTYILFPRQEANINDAGQILYRAYLQGPGIPAGSDHMGMIVDDAVSRRVITQVGQNAPGNRPDLVFNRLDLGDAVINAKGQVAFSAQVAGMDLPIESASGIWLERTPGQLQSVVQGGDPAPGGGLFQISSQQPLVLNEHGQIAFGAHLLNNEGSGIWATDRLGAMHLVARNGSEIEVAPGDVRTISTISFLHLDPNHTSSGLEDGRRAAFNNRGEVVFHAVFEDGTRGLFVSSLVAVPEPSTLALSLVLASAVLHRRRRKTGQFG